MVLVCEHSPLSLAAARLVTEQLGVLYPKLSVEVRAVRGGARSALRAIGRNGADAAVARIDTLPDELPPGLEVSIVAERMAPFQALVSASGALLDDLPAGARVAVFEDLARIQLFAHRDDLDAVMTRRELDSCVRRVRRSKLEGLIAPIADLELLGWQDAVTEVLDGSMFLPGPGRGAVALVAAEGGGPWKKWLEALEDAPSRTAVAAETALVRALNGIQGHVGVLAQVSEGLVHVEAALWNDDGRELVRDSIAAGGEDGATAGLDLADRLCDLGGGDLLKSGRRSARPTERVSGGSSARE